MDQTRRTHLPHRQKTIRVRCESCVDKCACSWCQLATRQVLLACFLKTLASDQAPLSASACVLTGQGKGKNGCGWRISFVRILFVSRCGFRWSAFACILDPFACGCSIGCSTYELTRTLAPAANIKHARVKDAVTDTLLPWFDEG